MPDRKGATLLEDLPGEIIDMILVRLPSKDVGRCRAVSTSWRSATSTSEFMLEHHRRQPLLPIIDGRGRPASFVVLRDDGVRASNQQLWPFLLPGVKNHSKHAICASCDGYLIRYDGSRYYICNPVICKEALLPWPQVGEDIRNKVIGFYRHHPTGEYRVLWVSSFKNFSKCSLYVLTVGSNEPRHVKVTMPTVSLPSVEQKLLKELHSYPEPVHSNGNLHYWCPYVVMGDGGDIIVFDTEAESFRSMCSPYQYQPSFSRKLFSTNGTLAFWGISTLTIPDIDIWGMQDYEAEIWAVKYRIDLVKVEASRQLYLSSSKRKNKTPFDPTMQSFNDMILLNERELLIMFNNNHVLRCDIDGKFLGMVNIGKHQYCMTFTHHFLQESIIPIPSHEMKGEDEEPPFSTGHI